MVQMCTISYSIEDLLLFLFYVFLQKNTISKRKIVSKIFNVLIVLP